MKRQILGATLSLFVFASGAAVAQPVEGDEGGAAAGAPDTGATEEPEEAGASAGGGFQFGVGGDGVTDSGTQDESQDPAEVKPLPWSLQLSWDQSATTDTLGVGQDRQSNDPVYDMTFTLRGAYKVLSEETWSASVGAEIGAFREFTNSNSTTREGEWSLSDARLQGSFSKLLLKDGDFATSLGATLPVLTFPTSKISANTGRILGLGAGLSLGQTVPLLGSKSSVLRTFSLTGLASYNHTFTHATTPVNGDFERARITPSGRAELTNQLSSGLFAAHQAAFTLAGTIGITKMISWTNSFSWRPNWKYAPTEVDCVQTVTGCVELESGADDPQDFSVVTVFASEVGVQVIPEFSLAVGYANGTLQLGPDGARRNMLYSPDARAYLTLTGHIDAIYDTVSGRRDAAKRQAEAKQSAFVQDAASF